MNAKQIKAAIIRGERFGMIENQFLVTIEIKGDKLVITDDFKESAPLVVPAVRFEANWQDSADIEDTTSEYFGDLSAALAYGNKKTHGAVWVIEERLKDNDWSEARRYDEKGREYSTEAR